VLAPGNDNSGHGAGTIRTAHVRSAHRLRGAQSQEMPVQTSLPRRALLRAAVAVPDFSGCPPFGIAAFGATPDDFDNRADVRA